MLNFEHIQNTIILNEAGVLNSNLDDSISILNQWPLELKIEGKNAVELQVIFDVKNEANLDVCYLVNKNVQLKLVEVWQFKSKTNYKRTLKQAENSHCQVIILNQSDHQDLLFVDEHVSLEKDASIKVGYGELGNGSQDSSYVYDLNGEGATANISLAALSCENDNKHFEVVLNHHAPFTYGEMENYGACKDHSILTFDGVGRIDQGMHQSSTHQTSKIMVFDGNCVARANPYLYIDDYDVKASHAAGVGRMDDEHLYYLQSRGLTKSQAMHLITYGYLLPAILNMKDDEVTARFETMLEKKVGNA